MENKKSNLWRNPLNGSNLRNFKCLCGSGKKIKRCHGFKYTVDANELNEITRMIESYNAKDKADNIKS